MNAKMGEVYNRIVEASFGEEGWGNREDESRESVSIQTLNKAAEVLELMVDGDVSGVPAVEEEEDEEEGEQSADVNSEVVVLATR